MATGGATALLALALAAPAFAAFSGANGRIVFVSYRINGQAKLFTLDPTNANPSTTASQLTDGDDDLEPAVSPNGATVAFSRNNGASRGIFLVPMGNTNNESAVTVAVDTAADETDPTWSPDGHTLVYVSTEAGFHVLRTIDTANLAAGSSLLFADPGVNDDQPAIDPADPTKVLYVRTVGGVGNLYVYDTVAHTNTNLSNVSANDAKPDWNPAGTWIVFQSTRGGGASQIWSMKADGTHAHALLSTASTTSDTRPAFSPDGTKVVFVRPAAGFSGELDTESAPIAMNAAGPGTGPSVDPATLVDITKNVSKDDMPNWAPVPVTGPALPESPVVGLLALGGVAAGAGVLGARSRRKA